MRFAGEAMNICIPTWCLFYLSGSFEPAHEIIFLSSSLNSFLNAHMQPSSGVRCLIFGQTLRLLPYSTSANSEGSGETARMCRLAWAFAGHLCDKYHNLMRWLIWASSWENLFSGFSTRQGSNQSAQLRRLDRVMKLHIMKLEILYYLGSKQQRRWSDCADAKADLRLCCSLMA